MASHPATTAYHQPVEPDSNVFFKVATMLLGILVAVVSFFALMMWADAREARHSVPEADAAVPAATHNHATDHNTALPLNSFAGVVPENALALAEAHKAYDAALPPVPAGDARQGAHDPEGHDRRDRARHQVQHLGLRRTWRSRPGRACARRPDGRDDPEERRRDPALDRLPRRSDRAERRLQGRGAG